MGGPTLSRRLRRPFDGPDRDAPRQILKHRMNRRVSSGSSDGRVEAYRDDLATGSSAPDEPTMRRCNGSEQLC
jgi:hypothetical protein